MGGPKIAWRAGRSDHAGMLYDMSTRQLSTVNRHTIVIPIPL
jgi:hypothetical protein